MKSNFNSVSIIPTYFLRKCVPETGVELVFCAVHNTTLLRDLRQNLLTWRHLYCVFTFIYSLLIEKDLSESRKVTVKFPYVYLCLSSGELFVF
jgi:hypothetical protein